MSTSNDAEMSAESPGNLAGLTDSDSAKGKNMRKQNYSAIEIDTLVSALEKRSQLASGHMGGEFATPQAHKLGWDAVCQEVNEVSWLVVRETQEIKLKWMDLKSRTKRKAAKLKQMKEDSYDVRREGGPPRELTPLEERVLRLSGHSRSSVVYSIPRFRNLRNRRTVVQDSGGASTPCNSDIVHATPDTNVPTVTNIETVITSPMEHLPVKGLKEEGSIEIENYTTMEEPEEDEEATAINNNNRINVQTVSSTAVGSSISVNPTGMTINVNGNNNTKRRITSVISSDLLTSLLGREEKLVDIVREIRDIEKQRLAIERRRLDIELIRLQIEADQAGVEVELPAHTLLP